MNLQGGYDHLFEQYHNHSISNSFYKENLCYISFPRLSTYFFDKLDSCYFYKQYLFRNRKKERVCNIFEWTKWTADILGDIFQFHFIAIFFPITSWFVY